MNSRAPCHLNKGHGLALKHKDRPCPLSPGKGKHWGEGRGVDNQELSSSSCSVCTSGDARPGWLPVDVPVTCTDSRAVAGGEAELGRRPFDSAPNRDWGNTRDVMPRSAPFVAATWYESSVETTCCVDE
ncbi:hypothetical protein RRG08_012929 [Elysia crispata]|uniref:Uncharacterized protein n=1 Tax=Elysia crispata TaxID=231223 RepID=A0AAE0ZZW4_9GAST|nr:hypothetical protein RRG08_012929 [Elysia crispata]